MSELELDEPLEPTDAEIPSTLPVLPLKETVVFPQSVSPLAIGQERSIKLVDDVLEGDRMLALVTVRNDVDQPGTSTIDPGRTSGRAPNRSNRRPTGRPSRPSTSPPGSTARPVAVPRPGLRWRAWPRAEDDASFWRTPLFAGADYPAGARPSTSIHFP